MVLEARGIWKSFDGVQVLRDAWIEVEQGQIVGLIGPNGAGKSTFLAVLSKFITPDHGRIVFQQHDISRTPPDKLARMGMSRTFQVPREFGELTVLENLLVAAKSQAGESIWNAWFRFGLVNQQEKELSAQARNILQFLKLDAMCDLPAKRLSGGQKKLLELGRILMLEPQLLLLDEPFAGVNPALIDQLIEQLLELRRRGLTLLVVEHNMYAINALSDVVYVIVDGSILTRNEPQEIRKDARVLEAYLGSY